MRLLFLFLCWCCCGAQAEPNRPLGLPPLVIPADNPQTPAKIALGKQLFHDPRFSQTGEVSCASCHNPLRAFTDHRPVSSGIHRLEGARNAPTVINAALLQSQFWDGRAADLEEQAIQPMLNPIEMGMPDNEAVLRVVRSDTGYSEQFQAVFGVTAAAIGIRHVANAIASYERTLIAGDSPFDHYYFNNDQAAISQAAKRGLSVFFNRAACASCHTLDRDYTLLTDQRFHNIGVGYRRLERLLQPLEKGSETINKSQLEAGAGEHSIELGRFVITGNYQDIGAFKTPTLRNIAKTAPYMHDGSLQTLAQVVDYYDSGGAIDGHRPQSRFIDARIRPLGLTEQQKSDLIAFMETLTSPEYRDISPPDGKLGTELK